jgi:hypothetical protein
MLRTFDAPPPPLVTSTSPSTKPRCFCVIFGDSSFTRIKDGLSRKPVKEQTRVTGQDSVRKLLPEHSGVPHYGVQAGLGSTQALLGLYSASAQVKAAVAHIRRLEQNQRQRINHEFRGHVRACAIARRTPEQKPQYKIIVPQAVCTFK